MNSRRAKWLRSQIDESYVYSHPKIYLRIYPILKKLWNSFPVTKRKLVVERNLMPVIIRSLFSERTAKRV
jgi:hypothetical protein